MLDSKEWLHINLEDFRILKANILVTISQYEIIDKDISKLPLFVHDDQLRECLTNCALCQSSSTAESFSKLLSSISNIKFEFIIENQRGSTILGIPMYTSKSLLQPLDPPKFQTLNGKALESTLMYPLPGSNWCWVWKEWHILMLDNMDENGWTYSSTGFRGRCWYDAKCLGAFVRRRLWLRMAEEKKLPQKF